MLWLQFQYLEFRSMQQSCLLYTRWVSLLFSQHWLRDMPRNGRADTPDVNLRLFSSPWADLGRRRDTDCMWPMTSADQHEARKLNLQLREAGWHNEGGVLVCVCASLWLKLTRAVRSHNEWIRSYNGWMQSLSHVCHRWPQLIIVEYRNSGKEFIFICVYGCFDCMHVCVPAACLVPMKAR
jgi:hypothetical protein